MSVPPKKNAAYTFYTSLMSRSDANVFQANPTLAAGDAKVSIDGGALNNLATLPDTEPNASNVVRVQLSAAEMNGDNIVVVFSDAADAEWQDQMILLQTGAVTTDELVRSTTPANTLDVSATGEAGLDLSNVKQATAPTTLTNITVPTVTDLTNLPATAATATNLSTVDTVVDAIKVVTDNLATMYETDGAVKRLTANALEQAPSGGATVADIWAYATRTLTQTAAAITAILSGTTLTIQRGDSLSASFTGLSNLTGNTEIWFTVKHSPEEADTAALIQIKRTVGLVYLNGAAGTAANGTLTVTDPAAGALTVTLTAAETAKLAAATALYYDLQMLTASGITTLTSGAAVVAADVTRATS